VGAAAGGGVGAAVGGGSGGAGVPAHAKRKKKVIMGTSGMHAA
jgi:hypothetical protein